MEEAMDGSVEAPSFSAARPANGSRDVILELNRKLAPIKDKLQCASKELESKRSKGDDAMTPVVPAVIFSGNEQSKLDKPRDHLRHGRCVEPEDLSNVRLSRRVLPMQRPTALSGEDRLKQIKASGRNHLRRLLLQLLMLNAPQNPPPTSHRRKVSPLGLK
jgi:hypothetical protein